MLPGESGYPVANQLSSAEFDTVDPAAVADCASEAEVALCLSFVQYERLDFAVRSGGHSAAGYSTSTGLVIDVSGLDSLTLTGSRAVVGPGTQLVDATAALAPHGLALPGGFCPTVALGGFLQGGGIGLLTHLRRHRQRHPAGRPRGPRRRTGRPGQCAGARRGQAAEGRLRQ